MFTEDFFIKNGWYVAKTSEGNFYSATLNYPDYNAKPFWQINFRRDNMLSVYSSVYSNDNNRMDLIALKKVTTVSELQAVLRFCDLSKVADDIVN